MWLLGRTEVEGPSDLHAAVSLEHTYRLTSLSGSGVSTAQARRNIHCTSAPQGKAASATEFFDRLSLDMAIDPPLAQDRVVVAAMAPAGIRSDHRPHDGTQTVAASVYPEAIRLGEEILRAGVATTSTTTASGWHTRPIAGNFGTNYVDRAIVAEGGLGQQVRSQAVYYRADSAEGGTPLTGAGGGRYVITFGPNDLPPIDPDGFWSITMYNAQHFLVANPIARYSIGNRTAGLVKGHGGSLSVTISASQPSGPGTNWLPAPDGSFEVILRVYAPRAAVATGRWEPPPVEATTPPG